MLVRLKCATIGIVNAVSELIVVLVINVHLWIQISILNARLASLASFLQA